MPAPYFSALVPHTGPTFFILPLPMIILLGALLVIPLLKRIDKDIIKFFVIVSLAFSIVSFLVPLNSKLFSYNPLGLYFSLFFLGVSLLVAIYTTNPWQFYPFIILVDISLLGASLVNDLFTFYVFLEALILSSTFLAYRGTKHSVRAAERYLIMNVFASILLLFGIALSLSFGGVLVPSVGLPLALIQVALICKCGIFPFHSWVPTLYSNTSSSGAAIMSSSVSVMGFLGLIRFFPSGGNQTFLFLGIITALYASLMAIKEWDIKKLLAYSSLMHFGYILFALSLSTRLGLFAAIVHLFNHGITKALLFMCTGLLISRKSKNLMNMRGHGRNIVGFIFLLGLLSVAGIPPFNTFISELLIVLSALESGHLMAVLALLLSSVIALTLYLRILYFLFFKKPSSPYKVTLDFGIIPLVIMGALVVLLGIYPDPLFSITESIVDSVAPMLS